MAYEQCSECGRVFSRDEQEDALEAYYNHLETRHSIYLRELDESD